MAFLPRNTYHRLRNRTYNAEHLTDLNYLPLGNLFIEDDGSFTLADVDDYESLSQQQRFKLTGPMMKKLCAPQLKAGIAQALSAIFPNIPKDLVMFEGMGKFNLNLTLGEILEIAIACGNELSPKQEAKDKKIQELEAQLAELKTQS